MLKRDVFIAFPALNYVPRKYHPYLLPAIRRVYPSPPEVVQALEQHNDKLRADNHVLKSQIKSLKKKNEHLVRDKQTLMDRCEASQQAVANYRETERQLRDELDTAKDEFDSTERELEDMEQKYKELKEKYHKLKKSVAHTRVSLFGFDVTPI